MNDKLTCCPHCGTSFRVSEDQLRTAKGAVRCGSCLRIFAAPDHLVEDSGSPAETQSHSPEDDTAEPELRAEQDRELGFDEELLLDENVDLNQLDAELEGLLTPSALDTLPGDSRSIEDTQTLKLDLEGLHPDFQPQGQFGSHPGALFDRQLKVVDGQMHPHADETWALSLLEELQSEEARSSDGQTPPADTDALVARYYSPPGDGTSDTPADPATELSGAPVPTRATLSISTPIDPDRAGGEAEAPRQRPPAGNTSAAAVETDAVQDRSRKTAEPAAEQQREHTSGDADTTPASTTEEDLTGAELLTRIAPAPVEMEARDLRRRWPRRLGWGLLSLVAALGLIAQGSWLYFDRLAQMPAVRPWLASTCTALDCRLPPLRAPDLVKATNLVVRSHPAIPGALLIDSVLLNTAGFAQPFPDFLLSFSDLQGRLLAERRFQPREYLAGELAGAHAMPSRQPVHITLAIVDPGEEAVNYAAAIPLD